MYLRTVAVMVKTLHPENKHDQWKLCYNNSLSSAFAELYGEINSVEKAISSFWNILRNVTGDIALESGIHNENRNAEDKK